MIATSFAVFICCLSFFERGKPISLTQRAQFQAEQERAKDFTMTLTEMIIHTLIAIAAAIVCLLLGLIGLMIFYFIGMWEPIVGISLAIFSGAYFVYESREYNSTGQAMAIGGFIAAMLLFVVGLALSVIDEEKTESESEEVEASSPPPKKSIAPSRRGVSTDIDDLLDTYAENQIAGRERFEKNTIRVRGRVVRVRESFGAGIAILESPDSGRTQEFEFSERGTLQLADLRPGDIVVVTCSKTIEAMGAIFVRECSAAKKLVGTEGSTSPSE